MGIDSSKDLEKDEREWLLHNGNCYTGPPLVEVHCYVVPKTRLQQVEVERNQAQDQSCITEISDRMRAAQYDANQYKKEVDHLRKIIAEKDLMIKVSEEHTQHWEDKCAE